MRRWALQNGVLSGGDLDSGSRAGKLSLTNLFSLPSVFWSVGLHHHLRCRSAQSRGRASPGGLRRDRGDLSPDCPHRLPEYEDNLAALRILEEEAQQQDRAVKTAEMALLIAFNRYRGGVTTYSSKSSRRKTPPWWPNGLRLIS